MAAKPKTVRELRIGRPRAWSPQQDLVWNLEHDVSFNGDRRQRFAERIGSIHWRVQRPFEIDQEELLDSLPRLASSEKVWATNFATYRLDGVEHMFVGIAVGIDQPQELRFYLPDETGHTLLAFKPVEHELLDRLERAMLVAPANIKPGAHRNEIIQWPDFCATVNMTAAAKRTLAQKIVDFVDAGFPKAQFKGDFVQHLDQMYNLRDRHYTQSGCYDSNFGSSMACANFLEKIVCSAPPFGNGNERHTLSDVEYWVAEVLIDRGYLPAYRQAVVEERLLADRAEYERLRDLFGEAPVSAAAVPPTSKPAPRNSRSQASSGAPTLF